MLTKITREPVLPEEAIQGLERAIHGSVVTFMGTVRRYTEDREVDYLEYEAYPEMAEDKIIVIANEVLQKSGIEDITVLHRIGRLHVGETSLVVAVASLHRREGFEACLYTVERIKEVVPIWKKEVWAEGELWVRSEGV